MRFVDVLFGGEANSRLTDTGLLILRVFSGLALALAHGWGKIPPSPGFVGMIGGMGMPAPELFAWLAGIAEFGGGLLIAVGLLTRPASLLVAGHFVFVVLLAHAGDPFGGRELPLFFLVTALLFLLSGAGRYSVDAALGRRGAPTRSMDSDEQAMRDEPSRSTLADPIREVTGREARPRARAGTR